MKNRFFHWLPTSGVWSYRFASLLFTCVIISWSVFPQTIPLLPSTNHALLEVYIDQAASTRTRNDWLRIARGGFESVLAEWEAAAALVITDSRVLQSGRKKVLKDLEQSLSTGLSEWAVTQFRNQHDPRGFSDFWVQMREAALTATFESRSGEFIKDEKGRLVVIKADRETLAEDSAAFKNFWDELIDQKVDDWYSGAQTAFSELLLDFGSEEAAILETYRQSTLSSLKQSYSRELSKMTRLTESAMIHYRLKNIVDSDSDAGGQDVIPSETRAMLNQVQNDAEAGLTRLKDGLNVNQDAPEVKKADIDAARWRASFREELEKGILLWREAEERLLMNRIEWEKKAGYDLVLTRKRWDKAFRELAEANEKWLDDYQRIWNEGQDRWEIQSRQMQNTLENARSEMASNINGRHDSMVQRVSTLVDILGQSLIMMSTARENFAYWMNKAAPYSQQTLEQVSWDIEDLRARYNRAVNLKKYSHGLRWSFLFFNDKAGEQARYWLEDIYNVYLERAQDVRADLYQTYNLSVFGESGLDEMGLKDLTSELKNGQWEQIFLDDYQVELLKARAAASYWEKELEIAAAVTRYAEKPSSILGSEEEKNEVDRAWTESFDAYQKALETYQAGIKKLEMANLDLKENSRKLTEVQKILTGYREELAEARAVYQNEILLKELDSSRYFKEQIRDSYVRLLELYGLTDDEKKSTESFYMDYLNKNRAYEGEFSLSQTSLLVTELIEGDPGRIPPILSLQDLGVRYENARDWNTANLFSASRLNPDFMEKFQKAWNLSIDEEVYLKATKLVKGLSAQYDADGTLDTEAMVIFQADIAAITAGLLRNYRTELESVVNQIVLLTSEHIFEDTGWAGSSVDLSRAESEEDVKSALKDEAQRAKFTLIADRITFDKEVLFKLKQNLDNWMAGGLKETDFRPIQPNDINDQQSVLAWIYYSSLHENASFSVRLKKDLEFLAELEEVAGEEETIKNFSSLAEAFRQLIPANPLASIYINGRSLLMRNDEDYGAIFLADQFSTHDQSVQGISHWNIFGPYSVSGRQMAEKSTIAEIYRIISRHGLADSSDGAWQFLNPETVWENAHFQSREEVSHMLVHLSRDLEDMPTARPVTEHVMEALERWQKSLEDYFLVKSHSFSDDLDEEEIQTRLEELEAAREVVKMNTQRHSRIESTSEPLMMLALSILIHPNESSASETFIRISASELAGMLTDLNSDLDAESTWLPLLTDLKETLGIQPDDEVAGVLDDHFLPARILAAQYVREASGIARGEAAYADQILYSRLTGLSLESYASMIGQFESENSPGELLNDSYASRGNLDELQNNTAWEDILAPALSDLPGSKLYQATLAEILITLTDEPTARWYLAQEGIDINFDSTGYSRHYALDERAALFFLKREALWGTLTDEKKEEFSLSDESARELEKFSLIAEALHRYIPAVDGNLIEYLGGINGISESEAGIILSDRWNDLYFQKSIQERTLSDADQFLWVNSSLDSLNQYHKAAAFSQVSHLAEKTRNTLAAESKSLDREDSRLKYAVRRNELREKSPGIWRLYLDAKYMQLRENEEWSGSIGETEEFRTGETEFIDRVPLYQGESLPLDSRRTIYQAKDRTQAALLETFNQLALTTDKLNDVLKTRDEESISDSSMERFKLWAEELSSRIGTHFEPEKDPVPTDVFQVNQSLKIEVESSRSEWHRRESEISSLQSKIRSFGQSISNWIENIDQQSRPFITGSQQVIKDLNVKIDAVEERWKNLIGPKDDPQADTYRGAEYRYSRSYNEVQSSLKSLDAAKQNFKKSKAIRDYSSSYHLYLGRDIASEERPADRGESLQMDELQQIIDAARPEKYLGQVSTQYHRSRIVVETLENIQQKTADSLSERDSLYRKQSEEVNSARRLEVALKSLSNVLTDYTEKTLGEYERIYQKREAVLRKFTLDLGDEDDFIYNFRTDPGGSKLMEEQVLLNGMDVHWDRDGRAHITFDLNGFDEPDRESSVSGDPSEIKELRRVRSFYGYKFEKTNHDYYMDMIEQVDRSSEYMSEEELKQPLYRLRDDEERLSRLKQFFGIEPAADGMQTYEDLLHQLLVFMSRKDRSTLAQWLNSVTYETAHFWKHFPRKGSSDYAYSMAMRYSVFGKSPEEVYGGRIREESSGASYNVYINSFQSDFEAIESKRDTLYQFFKFAVLSNKLKSSSPIISFQRMNESLGQMLLYVYTERRVSSWWDRFWTPHAHSVARKKADENRDYYTEQAQTFLNLSREYADLTRKESSIKSQLNIVNGKDDLGMQQLFTALGEAVWHASTRQKLELADWLQITEDHESFPDKWTASQWAANLAICFAPLTNTLNPTVLDAAGSFGQLMDLLVGISTIQRESRENTRNTYLYGLNGIAENHENNVLEFKEAWKDFQKSGLLPLKNYNLDDAESRLNRWTVNGEKSDLAPHIQYYLNQYVRDAVPVSQIQIDLQTAMMKYRDLIGENPLEANQAFMEAAEYFSTILQNYRIGETFIASARQAWSQPVFNKRDILTDSWNADKTLYEELLSGSNSQGILASRYILPGLKEILGSVFNARMDGWQEVRLARMSDMVKEGQLQHEQWNKQMQAILARGKMEWQLARIRLEAERENWKEDFQNSFQENLEAWNLQYQLFLEKKTSWVSQTTKQAVNIGDRDILLRFGAAARESIAEAEKFVMPDLPDPPDLSNFMGRILDTTLLAGLLENAHGLNDGIDAIEPVVFTSLTENSYLTGDILDKIRFYQTEENEELSARMALIQYERMLDTLHKAVKGLRESVHTANADFADSMKNMLMAGGFKRVGKNFIKNTMVTSTLWETKYADHYIEGSSDYEPNIRNLSKEMVPVSDSLIEEFGYVGIQALLDRAVQGLEDEQKRIFGGEAVYIAQTMTEYSEKYDEYDNSSKKWITRTRTWYEVDPDETISAEEYRKQVRAWENADSDQQSRSRYIKQNGGEFNAHIGYAPQFKPQPDTNLRLSDWKQNVRFTGSGEQGRIIGLFSQHQLIEAVAIAEFNKPFYEKKLWDDRFIDFKSLSLRSVVDISTAIAAAVVSTVATVVVPAAGIPMMMATAALTAGITLTDDLVFSIADMATGYRTPAQAMESLVKKNLSTFASSAIGSIGSGIFEGAGALGKSLIVAARTGTNQVAVSTINAIDFTAADGDFFDEDAFLGGLNPGSIVMGMAGSFVQFSLNEVNLAGYLGMDYKQGQILHRTIGTGVNASLEYGFQGETSLNLLSFSDFFMPFSGDGKAASNSRIFNSFAHVDVGLLQVNLGQDGITANIGMGGHRMNAGAIVHAINGLDIYRENARIARSNIDDDLTVAMRTLYSARAENGGTRVMRDLYEDILVGKRARLRTANRQTYDGKTELLGGIRVINLNKEGKSDFDLAVLLAHEAWRDGIDSGELANKIETSNAAFGHMSVAAQIASTYGYDSLNEHNADEARAFNEAGISGDWNEVGGMVERYDWSGEYWKLIRKEDASYKIVWDGEKNLYDENGNLLSIDTTDSYALSLSKYLGLARTNDWRRAAVLLTDKGVNINKERNGYVQSREHRQENGRLGLDEILSFNVGSKRQGEIDSYLSSRKQYINKYNMWDMVNLDGRLSKIGGKHVRNRAERARIDFYQDVASNPENLWKMRGNSLTNPVQTVEDGQETYITVADRYNYTDEAGVHYNGIHRVLFSENKAVDIGSQGISSPVFTIGPTTFMRPRWQNVDKKDSGYGYFASGLSRNFGFISGHLNDNNSIQKDLDHLFDNADQAGFNVVQLPDYTSYGMTGTTGNSTAIHLHYEVGHYDTMYERLRKWLP